MGTKKVLIIDKMHESLSSMLESIGLEPLYRPKITREEIIAFGLQCVGLIVRSKTPVDKELLQSQRELRFIGRAGAGIDNLDVEYLESRNIAILNAPEGNRDALGEHMVGMLLALNHKLLQGNAQIKSGIWDREANRGIEIKGKTVGLLGYGFMGTAFAEKLSGFGCEVLAYDRYKRNYGNQFARAVEMEEIFETADIFSLHVPLTDLTKNLVNLDYLNRFDKNIVLLNSARGEVVVTNDLLQAMKSGKVTHAALDVLENEKLDKLTGQQKSVYDELFKMPNVILSPHVAGWTYESYENINRVLVEKIAKLGI